MLHPSPSHDQHLEVFSRPGIGNGFMFYNPRHGCWVKQVAIVLQELKQWLDVNHMLWSPGSPLVWVAAGSPGAWAVQPREARTLLLSFAGLLEWVFFYLHHEWEVAMICCLLLSLQSGSSLQNKLCATKVSAWRALKSFGWSLEWKNSKRDTFKCLSDCQLPCFYPIALVVSEMLSVPFVIVILQVIRAEL